MNKNIAPLIVPKEQFNLEFIKNLNDETNIIITGNYTLTKEDYNNLLLYTNIDQVEVNDVEDFEYQEDLKIIVHETIEFKTEQFKKIKINKVDKYTKTSLTIKLPFKIYFENDCL